jgi:hypothetical protein
MATWNKKDFQDFLTDKQKLSPIVARNHADRCLRVERVLNVDLVKCTKDAKSFNDISIKLHQHFIKYNPDKRKVYFLNGTHMSAVRKLGTFIWGRSVADTYPKYQTKNYKS